MYGYPTVVFQSQCRYDMKRFLTNTINYATSRDRLKPDILNS